MLWELKQNLVHTRTESSIDHKHISVPVSSKHISKELGLGEKKRGTSSSHFFPPETCVLPLTQLSHLGPWVIHRFSQVCGPANSPCTALQSPDLSPASCGMFAFFYFFSFLLAPTLLRPLHLSSGLSQWILNYCLCLEGPPFPFLHTKFKMHLPETLLHVGWPFQWMSLASCHLKNKGSTS